MLPVLLAILLAFFIWLDTDFHHTRQQIESSFKQFTGHNLVIKGGLSLEFWPATRFVSRQVEVNDQQGNVLFTAERLAAEVAPLSIFSEEIQGENLVLEKVQIHIVREPVSGDSRLQYQPAPLQNIPFKSIQITDSAIHIDDRINGKRHELNNLQIALESGAPGDVTINGSVDFVYDDILKGSMVASSTLGMSDQLDFEDVVVQLDLRVYDKPLALTASGAFSLEPDGQLLQIREAKLESQILALKAVLSARQRQDSLALKAEINNLKPAAVIPYIEPEAGLNQVKVMQSLSAEIELHKSASEIRIDIPSLELDNSLVQGSMVFSDKSKQIQFKIDEVDIDPYLELLAVFPYQTDQTENKKTEDMIFAIQFNRLVSAYGVLEGLSTKGHLRNDQLLSVEANLMAEKFNLNGLTKAYKVLVPDNKFVSSLWQGNELALIDGQLKVRFDNETVSLSDLDLKIDDTSVKGNVEYSMHPPMLNAQMQLGKLDLDRYLYLFAAEDKPADSDNANAGHAGGIIERLKQLKGNGSIQIDMLRYLQTDYQKIDIQFNDA